MSGSSLWLVGCGNMGGAMLRGWLDADIAPDNITIIDPFLAASPAGSRLLAELPDNDEQPARIILAIKPQMLGEVAPRLARHVGAGTQLVSILAGAECGTLSRFFPAAASIVRVMPNMPASIGMGVSAIFAPNLDAPARAEIEALFQPLGSVEWIDAEDLFHPVIAVSGSGPAFVFRFIEAMAAAGASLGLEEAQALRLALATVQGAAALAAQSDASPATLAEQVRSPNGTTNAGLIAMDEDGALLNVMRKTLQATDKRSREMARE